MRVPPHQFRVQVGGYVANVEVASLRRHLCIEQHLQQQVAQLILQIGPCAALDRVEDFVGLFQCVPLDRVEGLFAVPRASARPSQPRHNRNRVRQRLSGTSYKLQCQRTRFACISHPGCLCFGHRITLLDPLGRMQRRARLGRARHVFRQR